MFKTGLLKPGLYPGEMAWEVMEQSEIQGEIPLRICIGPNAIRTITSLILASPTDMEELWKANSADILKVSWCPELCVLSVLYFKENTVDIQPQKVEVVKVFLVEQFTGPKVMKQYKKMKPASVHLSPCRPFLPKEEKDKRNIKFLSTSFTLNSGLKNERFWRTIHVPDDLNARELYLGIGPTGIRILDPSTQEPEIVIDTINLIQLHSYSSYGADLLKLRFIQENMKGKPKKKKMVFTVHPAVARDINRYQEICILGEEKDLLDNLPPLRIPTTSSIPTLQQPLTDRPVEKSSVDSKKMSRTKSAANLLQNVESANPIIATTTNEDNNSSTRALKRKNTVNNMKPDKAPLTGKSLPPKLDKNSRSNSSLFSENKENINPYQIPDYKSGKDTLAKNNSILKLSDPQLKADINGPKKAKTPRGAVVKI